jgi:hypothetical protein
MAAERRRLEALETELSELVNDAYGLTPEEVDLLWRTAPPRMPVAPPAAATSPDLPRFRGRFP